jgi:hypothetical protein
MGVVRNPLAGGTIDAGADGRGMRLVLVGAAGGLATSEELTI